MTDADLPDFRATSYPAHPERGEHDPVNRRLDGGIGPTADLICAPHRLTAHPPGTHEAGAVYTPRRRDRARFGHPGRSTAC